jgi:stage II sporulation protein D
MKEYIVIVVVFAALLLITPVVFGANPANGSFSPPPGALTYDFPQSVMVVLNETGETIQLTTEEYLIGCLFAQIPLTYHPEALRAQAIAAHTYMLRLHEDGVEISDDPQTAQPFFTEEKARKLYGEQYDFFFEDIRAAARFGSTRAIFHENEPIYAVYHSISAGVTNTAFSVWGRHFPYLRSVESSWDREHPGFLAVNELSAETIRLAMFHHNRTASMPVDFDLWFVQPVINEFGYVVSIKAGESMLTGGDMWRVFNLRSTSFEISQRNGGIFVVNTRGFGHGVGLSQYGADVLGRRGFSAEDILTHYYTDVVVISV